MSQTTPLFAWRDRDTAARHMIDLARLAPPTIRLRALAIISSFKSAAVTDELIDILMDDAREIWERRYALYGLAAVPTGDLYLPQLAALISDKWDGLSADFFFGFIANHPRNRAWFFETIAQFPPKTYGGWLQDAQNVWVNDDFDMAELVYPYLLTFSQQYPDLMTELEITIQFDPNQPPEPSERWQPPASYPLNPAWGELVVLRDLAERGNEEALIALQSMTDLWGSLHKERAVALHLFGTLAAQYPENVLKTASQAFKYAGSPPRTSTNGFEFHYVRFEAGEILKNIPTPETWELMVDVFLSGEQDNDLQCFMEEWIEHLTDCLSNGNKPYTGLVWALPRYWLEKSPEES